NMIKREQFPYRAATGLLYDSGDFQSVLKKAIEHIDFERGSGQREGGRLKGVGLAFYVEVTGFGPAKAPSILGTVHGGHESVVLRFDPGGGVSIFTGLMPHGQGAETTLAQVAADLLGLELDDVKIIYGNTEECPYGHGTFGSRSAVVGANAILHAVNAVKEKARRIAAHMLEVNEGDLEYDSGLFYVKEARDKAVHIKDVARVANLGLGLPEDVEPGLEATVFYDPRGWTISYGAHIVTAEIDLETGSISIPRYLVVHDCGRILNPAVVEGQIMGGAAQGIGGALLEEIVYDERGQILTTSFMDYALPTAVELPNFTIKHVETYSTANPLGVRGAGEGATIPSAAAIASAVENALKNFNIEICSTPLNPERLWKKVHQP
ncbi:MAG: molybdopterin cofactor-binding domain-containing protein, partial [Nitrososphaerota archaeon]